MTKSKILKVFVKRDGSNNLKLFETIVIGSWFSLISPANKHLFLRKSIWNVF